MTDGRPRSRALAGLVLIGLGLAAWGSACSRDASPSPGTPETTTSATSTSRQVETVSTTSTTQADRASPPFGHGDDPELDALWDACEEGAGDACDQLFLEAPVGSDYEEFGYTCGDRPEVVVCRDLRGIDGGGSS